MGFDAIYYTVQEPLWREFLSHRNRVRLALDNLHSKKVEYVMYLIDVVQMMISLLFMRGGQMRMKQFCCH